MKVHRVVIRALAAMSIVASLFAQVSPQAPPKTEDLTKIEGKITKLEWSNPHVFLYVSVIDPDNDKVINWAIKTGSPSEFTAKGINRREIRVGMVVRAKGTPVLGKNILETPVSGLSFPD